MGTTYNEALGLNMDDEDYDLWNAAQQGNGEGSRNFDGGGVGPLILAPEGGPEEDVRTAEGEAWNERARRDPKFNPRDALIGRDRASWEQYLRAEAAANGVAYDPSDLEGVERQVSYAQNAGRDPIDFLREAGERYAARASPTFSGGGRGGDLDTNADAQLDPGWSKLDDAGGGRWQWWQGAGRQPNVRGVAPGQYHPSVLAQLTGQGGGGPPPVAPSRSRGFDWIHGGPSRQVTGDEWITQAPSDGGGGGPTTLAQLTGGLESPEAIRPFTESFSASPYELPELTAPGYAPYELPELTAPNYAPFQAPKGDDIFQDPGVAVALREGAKALESSAAARGSYFTPNTMRELMQQNQDISRQAYGDVYGRRRSEWESGYGKARDTDVARLGRASDLQRTGYGRAQDTDAARMSRASDLWRTNYGRAQDEFGTRRSIFGENEANRFGSQRSNRMDTLAALTGMNRANLENRQFDWSRDQDRWGRDFSNRQFAHSQDQDLWGRNRAGYLDDFNIWRTLDMDEWGKGMDLSRLGRPD